MEDNKREKTKISELEAWLLFIGSDEPRYIRRVIGDHPRFAELYREIVHFRYHPKEVVRMFSEALRILDENTVQYMIDEMMQELEEKKQENRRQEQELEEQKQENQRLRQLLAEQGIHV